MTLTNFLKDNKIEKIEPPIANAKIKLAKAFKILKNVKKMVAIIDNEIVYPSVHDAARITCEVILYLNGYRVLKSAEASHYIIIDCAKELAGESLTLEFIRIQKMRKKRNKLEYGDLDSISKSELEQAIKDLEKLLVYTRDLMETGEKKDKLI